MTLMSAEKAISNFVPCRPRLNPKLGGSAALGFFGTHALIGITIHSNNIPKLVQAVFKYNTNGRQDFESL